MPFFGPPNVEKLKARRDVKGLIKAMDYGKDARVRKAAVEALGQTSDPQAVESLIAAVDHWDWDVRQAAVEALANIKDSRAVSRLIDILAIEPSGLSRGHAKGLREAAVRSLRAIGPPAVDALLAVLKSGPIRVRQVSAEALGKIGGQLAIESLVRALQDDDAGVRQAAAKSLIEIGPPAVPSLIGILRDSSAGVTAAEALGKIGGQLAIESLVGSLQGGDTEVRQAAAKSLIEIGPPAVPSLIGILSDSSAGVTAAEALGKIGGQLAIESLVGSLQDSDAEIGQAAARALIEIGPPAVSSLTGILHDSNLCVTAADMLDRLGWKPDLTEIGARYWLVRERYDKCVEIGIPAVGSLIAALRDGDSNTRWAAARALGDIGDIQAVEPLVDALKDESLVVRQGAIEALGAIGDDQAVESLIVTLKDRNQHIRLTAAKALGQIGEAGAVEPLCVALRDQSGYVREAAAWALGKIGDGRAVEPLVDALKGDSHIRGQAVEALERLDWQPDKGEAGAFYWIQQGQVDRCVEIGLLAVEPLLATLESGEWHVREAVARTLGKIGDARAMGPLVATLKVRNANMRRLAAEALGSLGDARAVESLIAALGDEDRAVTQAAVCALDQLGWRPQDDDAGAAYWAAKGEWERCIEVGETGMTVLAAALKDKDGNVRKAVVEALAGTDDPRTVKLLTAALKDKDRDVRKIAANGLDRINWKPDKGTTGAAYHVVRRNWDKCIEIGNPAVESLIVALEEESAKDRGEIIKALGKIGDPKAVESLVLAFKEGISEAANALGQIGDWRAVEPLIQALQDDSKRRRQTAAQALITLYRSGNLGAGARQAILRVRETIAERHYDQREFVTRSSDCSHEGWRHVDEGIGIPFPV